MKDIALPKAFKEIFEPHRYKVYYGGRGSGKSESVARYLLVEGMREPMNILCCREFQSSIKDSVKQLLNDLIVQYELEGFYTVLNTEIRGKNGTTIIFAGLRNNIASIKSMHNIKKAWCEEAQTLSAYSLKVLFPTIRAEDSELIFTMNPDLEDDPAYDMLIATPPTNSLVVKVNYDKNPYFPKVLEQEKEDLKERNYDEYLHVWEGRPRIAVEGAIYANEIQKAKDDERIAKFPYDDRYPVIPFHDIGWADNTSIVFLQVINGRFRVIHSYQSQFQRTSHYVKELQDKAYNYNRIFLPHDAKNEHANADRTWEQIYKQAFPNASVVVMKRQPVQLRLDSVKNMFGLVDIDKENNIDLISALAHYHYAIDPQTGKSTREPYHGPESNFADAFGYMCMEMREIPKKKIKFTKKPTASWEKKLYGMR